MGLNIKWKNPPDSDPTSALGIAPSGSLFPKTGGSSTGGGSGGSGEETQNCTGEPEEGTTLTGKWIAVADGTFDLSENDQYLTVSISQIDPSYNTVYPVLMFYMIDCCPMEYSVTDFTWSGSQDVPLIYNWMTGESINEDIFGYYSPRIQIFREGVSIRLGYKYQYDEALGLFRTLTDPGILTITLNSNTTSDYLVATLEVIHGYSG